MASRASECVVDKTHGDTPMLASHHVPHSIPSTLAMHHTATVTLFNAIFHTLVAWPIQAEAFRAPPPCAEKKTRIKTKMKTKTKTKTKKTRKTRKTKKRKKTKKTKKRNKKNKRKKRKKKKKRRNNNKKKKRKSQRERERERKQKKRERERECPGASRITRGVFL